MSEVSTQEIPFSAEEIAHWQAANYQDIINFIESGYHTRHREQLPQLIELAKKVESVHSDSSVCPTGTAAILEKIYQDLEMHMRKEEQILFQMIKARQYAMARMPIQVMLSEHDEAEEDLKTLLTVTQNLILPEDACGSWQALYQGIATFVADLSQHIYFENEIFFARVVVETH